MPVFSDYAKFYDDFYQTKAYGEECDFLEQIFTLHAFDNINDILDIGCGSGGHLLHLAERGYRVEGVDQSENMLALARDKLTAHEVALHNSDIRELRLDNRFDAIISMFDVINYFVNNEDLSAAFRTASTHLKPKGVFIFDSWFGPAVFSTPPTDRCREVNRNTERIIRFSSIDLDPVEQVVQVQFTVWRVVGNSIEDEVLETHLMRPLFVQEVALIAERCGLELVAACPFMNLTARLTTQDWKACFILRKG